MESPSMNGGPQPRASSPPSGFSILITSAPMSPRIMPAIGPATACPISITLTPASGPFIAFSPMFFSTVFGVASAALVRIDQIFFAGRALAVRGDVGQLQRFLQRDLLCVVAGEGGLEFVHHALPQPGAVGGSDLLQKGKQQPAADAPRHPEASHQF